MRDEDGASLDDYALVLAGAVECGRTRVVGIDLLVDRVGGMMHVPLRMTPAGITSYTPVCDLYGAAGELICDLPSAEHAAFIVTACNAHAALVEALQDAHDYINGWTSCKADYGQGKQAKEWEAVNRAIEAALALAKVQP